MAEQADEVPRAICSRPSPTSDDHLMEKYLAGEEVTEDEVKSRIREGTLAFDFVPILCGSAFKNKGVQPMLDAVIDFLPSPLDIPPAQGADLTTTNEILTARPTRTSRSPRWRSRSSPTRSASSPTSASTRGQINKGDEVYNSTKEKPRAPRSHPADARQPARGPRRRDGRRHRCRPRLQGHHHGRHAVRSQPTRSSSSG